MPPETTSWTSAVAAPVFGSGGELAGIVALQGPTARLGRAELHAALPVLPERTAAISASLGSEPLRNGRTLQQFPRRTHLELDATGTVLTSFRVGEDGVLTTPVARNLRTGARNVLPLSCRVGVQRERVRFELCGYPYVKRRLSTIVRVDGNGRRTIAGPALRAARGPAGWWRSVTLSPDGRRLLAQWSGECEIPFAYFIDTRSGRANVLGRDHRGGQAEAMTLGWLGNAALVTLPHGACGSSAERPGVYAFAPRARPRLIHALPDVRPLTVAFWR